MKYKETKRFIDSGINRDVDPSLMPEVDVYDRKNAVMDEVLGVMVNMKGTTSNGYSFPALPGPTLIAKCIGATEWKQEDALIYFVVTHVSGQTTGNDYIIKYDRATDTNTLITDWSGFNFDIRYPIRHADIIDGILYFTDGLNAPRKVDVANTIAGTYTENEQYFSAAQERPWLPPRVIYNTDSSVKKNNLRGKQFQFCYRWIMQGNEKTATSMYSITPLPPDDNDFDGVPDDPYSNNVIEVSVLEGTELVKDIEIFVREGNDGEWVRFLRLNKEDNDILNSETGLHKVNFYNDTYLDSADQSEIAAVNDSFPQLSDVQKILDEGRIVYGGVTEGYPSTDIDVVTTPVFDDIVFGLSDPTGVVQTFTLVNEGSDQGEEWLSIGIPPNSLPTSGNFINIEFYSGSLRETASAGIPATATQSVLSFMNFITRVIEDQMPSIIVRPRSNTERWVAWSGRTITSESVTENTAVSSGTTEKGVVREFKAGATHPIGIVYFDKYGRNGGVNKDLTMDVKIPFYSESLDNGSVLGTHSATELQDTTKAWTVNQFAGKFVRITSASGGSAGDYRLIVSNTADTLTVSIAFTGTITDGDLYAIVDPTFTETYYDSGLASSGSTTVLTDTSKSFPSYAGWYVRMITGLNTGQARRIDTNTATEITVDGQFDSEISSGDRYVISLNSEVHFDDNRFKAGIAWAVKHQPPSWATHWAWVYAGNRTISTWIQYILGDYSSIGGTNPLDTPIGDPEHTIMDITSLQQNSDSVTPGSYYYPNSSIDPYSFNPGDRVRFITEIATGSATKPLGRTMTTYLDLEILGWDGDDETTNKLVLPRFDPDDYNIGNTTLVEIYSPRLEVSESVYYGTGEMFEVGNPGDSDRYHRGQSQDQDPADMDGTPATGVLFDGDSCVLARSFSEEIGPSNARVDLAESKNISDFYSSDSYSKGKPFVVLENPQQKKYQFFRWSNKYFSDTSVNGLSRFESGNRTKQLEDEFGDIVAIELAGTTLRVFQERKTSTVYIGRTVLQSDGSDQESVAVSGKVLGTIRPHVENVGTIFPNSVSSTGNWTYFFDIYEGKFYRMAMNGVYEISQYGMKNYFKEKAQALLSSGIENVDVIVHYDRAHNSVIVTFKDENDSSNDETIVFYEPSNKWFTFWEIMPEMYGHVGDRLFGFVSGGLIEFDSSSTRMNLRGSQKSFETTFVCNINPNKIKFLDAIGIETNNNKYNSSSPDKSWQVSEVTVPASEQYANGQYSKIPAIKFTHKNGRLYADFLRDAYTTTGAEVTLDYITGQKLMNNFFLITLKHTSTDLVTLKSAEIHVTDSELS